MFSWLQKHIHPSWLIATACLLFVVGVAVAAAWQWDALIVAPFLCLPIVFCIWRPRGYGFIIVALLGGGIGLLWGSAEQIKLREYTPYYGKTVQITGTVSDDPKVEHRTTSVQLRSIKIGGQLFSGKLWVSLGSEQKIMREDTVAVYGKLEPGFGVFAATMYKAQFLGVQKGTSIALGVREWFKSQLEKVLNVTALSLSMGFLTGEQSQLPPEVDKAFRTAGLIHIVVASGYNLTVLVQLARRLFSAWSHYFTLLATVGLILFFIGITGLSPSMTRAGIVSGLGLLAWYYGRTMHPFVLLPMAAAITVIMSPSYAWGDAGWLLSFASFAGVLIVAGTLQHYFFGAKPPGTVRQVLGETVAAWLCTFPVVALLFGSVSSVAIVANLLVVPLIPAFMLLTCIAGLLAVVSPVLAAPVAWLLEMLTRYIVGVATYLSSFEWSSLNIGFTWWMAAVFYVVFAGLILYLLRATKMRALLPAYHPRNTEVD